jgi:hypothetical protein
MFRMVAAFVLAVSLAPTAVNTADAESQRFTLSSPAFNDDAMLPLKYAGHSLGPASLVVRYRREP